MTTEQKARDILVAYTNYCFGGRYAVLNEDEATAEIMKLIQPPHFGAMFRRIELQQEEIARLRSLCLTLGKALKDIAYHSTYPFNKHGVSEENWKWLNYANDVANKAIAAMPEDMRKSIEQGGLD